VAPPIREKTVRKAEETAAGGVATSSVLPWLGLTWQSRT
jgi:hypothetical protein